MIINNSSNISSVEITDKSRSHSCQKDESCKSFEQNKENINVVTKADNYCTKAFAMISSCGRGLSTTLRPSLLIKLLGSIVTLGTTETLASEYRKKLFVFRENSTDSEIKEKITRAQCVANFIVKKLGELTAKESIWIDVFSQYIDPVENETRLEAIGRYDRIVEIFDALYKINTTIHRSIDSDNDKKMRKFIGKVLHGDMTDCFSNTKYQGPLNITPLPTFNTHTNIYATVKKYYNEIVNLTVQAVDNVTSPTDATLTSTAEEGINLTTQITNLIATKATDFINKTSDVITHTANSSTTFLSTSTNETNINKTETNNVMASIITFMLFLFAGLTILAVCRKFKNNLTKTSPSRKLITF